ncbi:Hypothetical_protein [Hexamita inflata]|uniref:Hypothetical_protein n=1 Tax=Hexamita inflata TaxID=28002 RepID=A0AA86U250_9EUKA|nr:Hypothetical protein HINF_LOCUS23027 [Hexamita inflata]
MSISQDNAFHLNWAFQIFSSSNYNAECCSNIIYAVKQLQMGWFEIVNNPKTLMQLQAILQKDSQYAKINEAPVHLLANYVQAKLPNTLDDAALRAVLNDIRASIGHLSARQLEVSKLTLQDQLDFIQEQINQNLKDTVQKYKNSLKSFVQDVFKQYLQELDQLITSDLKYRIEGIETDFQAKIAAFGTQTQPVQSTPKLNSTASTIGQNNEPIVQSSLQLSQTAQKTPVYDSKPRQKLTCIADLGLQDYVSPQPKTWQKKNIELRKNRQDGEAQTEAQEIPEDTQQQVYDLYERLNMVTKQTNDALEAVQNLMKEQNKKICDPQATEYIKSLEDRLSRLEGRK